MDRRLRALEEEFDAVRREFDLHELAVEDAIVAHQRPKVERYGDTLLVVLKTVRYTGKLRDVETGEILLFVNRDFLVSVRHGEAALHDVRLDIEKRPDLLRFGSGAVLYAIVDRIVDDYEPVVEAVEADIQEVEHEVFAPDPQQPGRADLHARARGARPAPRDRSRSPPRSTSSRAASTRSSTRSCAPTSATSTTTCCA